MVLSDHLSHDTVVVHHFQCKLIELLKKVMPFVKVIYFSDGAASQYKNLKNFINIAYHEAGFGMPAEWHFLQLHMGRDLAMELGHCEKVGSKSKRTKAL